MTAPGSDATQLRTARKDPEAFTAFYRDHAEWLDRWFRLQVGDPHLAADLTAETFAQALTSLRRFRGSGRGEGTAWLFGIGRNLLKRYLARKAVETRAREALEMPVRSYEPDEYDAADERLDAAALTQEIEQALGTLSPDLRRTLELRTVEGLDYAEIAERTGTRITRDLLLDTLADAGNEGMSDRLEERFRKAFEDVSNEFIAKLDLMTRIQGGQTLHEGRDGGFIAPPPGVPIQITCQGAAESRSVRCRDVSGATDIPLGAPVYTLLPTKDWVPYKPSTQEERWAEIETFFGRPLSADENLVFVYMGIAGGMSEAEWARLERLLDQTEEER